MKKKKLIIAILSAVVVICVSVGVTLGVVMSPVKGKPNNEFWLSDMKFDINDTVILTKNPDKDFKILNLTDIQYNDFLDIGKKQYTEDTIRTVVNQEKPDLITLTGDQVWAAFTKYSIKALIKTMDSFKIPWAPVMGNHDGEGNADANKIADMYEESEYCVFKKGPNNIGGIGNYIINIKENDKIIHTLFMMDSGSGRSYPDEYKDNYIYDKVVNDKGETEDFQVGANYDFIKESQIEWYKWAVNGIKEYNNNVMVESTAFFHIALPEYYFAYKHWEQNDFDPSIGFGEKNEDICSPKVNSGFFDVMKELGSTKNVIVGHDHVNSFSVLYQGIRLSYGLKTGDRCYAKQDGSLNGGTVITIGSKTNVEHCYINLKK